MGVSQETYEAVNALVEYLDSTAGRLHVHAEWEAERGKVPGDMLPLLDELVRRHNEDRLDECYG